MAKPSEGKRVVALDVMPWPPVVTFEDMAAYTVSLIDDDKAVKTSKYCGYALASAIHPPSVAGYVAGNGGHWARILDLSPDLNFADAVIKKEQTHENTISHAPRRF